jgi:hypothetical protein
MSVGTICRMIATAVTIVVIFTFSVRTKLDPNRVSLLLTAAICAATVLYAWITFEILLRNQSMAKAASDSAALMERGLRFSHASDLHFRTIVTKDPTLQTRKGCKPIENEDYQNAVRLVQANAQQMEYVFSLVQNVGQGPATNLKISADYHVHDTSNAITNVNVNKTADVQLLEPSNSVALLIYLFRVPTANDKAEILQATMQSSDAYRNAIGEQPITRKISRQDHHVEAEANCIATLS